MSKLRLSHLCEYKREKDEDEYVAGIETSADKASDFVGDSVAGILRAEFPDEINDSHLLRLCLIVNSDKKKCDDIRSFRKSIICRFDRLDISKLTIANIHLYLRLTNRDKTKIL